MRLLLSEMHHFKVFASQRLVREVFRYDIFYELKLKVNVEGIYIPHRFVTEIGTQENLLDDLLMSTYGLEQRIKEMIKNA
jgi:hypothetical protein